MKTTWILAAACSLLIVGTADAARRPKHKVVRKKAVVRVAVAETSLVGIHLMDSGVRVVNLYGTPDDIEGISVGGGAIGGGAGGPGAGGAGGGPRVTTGRGGAQGGAAGAEFTVPDNDPNWRFGDTVIRQFGPPQGDGGGGRVGAPPPGGNGPGAAGRGGGAPGAAGGTSERVTYTRWIYNRGGSKYGFVVDKFNRVIQIEAIGLQNAKVRTRSGIGFGATFARIMKTYGAPDGYEISGNTIVVRYLSRKKVAFRLNRLGEGKPHVVTGIVVAAGK